MTQPWEDFARQEESKPWEDFADSKVTESPTIMEDLVKPTLKSAIRVPATVVGGLGSSMVGGVSALGAAATQPVRNILYGTKIDPLTAANTELERWGKRTQYVQTPEEEQSLNYLMKVMKPVEMAGEGWAGLTELAATGDTQKATDVIKGRSAGTTPVSRAIIPAAATVGQASTLFGGPAALHRAPIVKNIVRDIVYEKSGLKGTEGVIEAPKAQPPVKPVSDVWLKDRLTEASLQETLRPKGPELGGTYWDYLNQMEKAQRWSAKDAMKDLPEEVRKSYERDFAPELPEGKLDSPAEIELPSPERLTGFDQFKLETLRDTDPALWSATDKLFMEKLGEKAPEPVQGAAEKPELITPEQYGGAKIPEVLPEAYRPSGKTFKEPVEQPTPFQEIWEAGTEVTEKPGFTIKDKRTFKNILDDVNAAVGKKGAVGEWERSPEALAAKERLKEDLKRFSEEAKLAGKDVAQYLKDIGASDEAMLAFARLTRESRDERQPGSASVEKPLSDLRQDARRQQGDVSKIDTLAEKDILKFDTPEKFIEDYHKKLDEVAQMQRGEPESKMLRLSGSDRNYEWQPSQLYAWAAEHIGDLTHRIFQKPEFFSGKSGAKEKIDKTISSLKNPYGFEKEVNEQIVNNYNYGRSKGKYQDQTLEEFRNEFIKRSKEYAEAHKKLPVYNEIGQLAKDAAIAVGEWRFSDATKALEKLKEYYEKGDWEELVTNKKALTEAWNKVQQGKAGKTDLGIEAEARANAALSSAKAVEQPQSVKGVFGKLEDKLKSEAGAIITAERKPFYSKLEEVVNRDMKLKMSIDQARKLAYNRGVTVDEWNDVFGHLRGDVTKGQLLDELAVHGRKFEDVVLGEKKADITEKSRLHNIYMEALDRADANGEAVNINVLLEKPYNSLTENQRTAVDAWKKMQERPELETAYDNVVSPVQFEQWTEPGHIPGSYRELFVTAPGDKKYSFRLHNQIAKELNQIDISPENALYRQQKSAILAKYDMTAKQWHEFKKFGWQDGHGAYIGISNPVVRIRFNERDVNGKKVLFVEEIQGPSPENQAKMPESLRSRIYDIGVKRVVSYAKENGFDEIAWTNGKMQADRYSLEKHLDEVSAKVQGDNFKIGMKDKKGNSYDVDHPVTAEELPEYVGKILAKRIIEEAPLKQDGVKYTGLDLKVGGEGLKRLYDETIPGLMEKYGGGKVRDLTIGDGKTYIDTRKGGKGQWTNNIAVKSLPLTDKSPSTFTMYSDPFGINAAFKVSKQALERVSESTGVKKYVQDAIELADDYLGSISTRLANIDPAIKYRLRRFEFNRESKITRYEKAVLPLIKAANKMSKADQKAFDIARKNGNKTEVNALAEKYGIQNELATTRQILDELYNEARKVGFNVKRYPEYHPREVNDFTGLMEYLHKTEGWTTIDTAIKAKEQKLQRYLTDQEKTKIVNSMLRGYATEQITLSKPGQLKARVISEITPEIDKFYADSDSALLRYITDVTDIIEARRLFGRTAKKYEGFDIDNSIGAYILDLRSKGKLSPAQERELTKILKARFHEVGTHGIVGLYKNAAYIDTMGSVMSAITQIGDAAFSIHKYGVGETAKGLGQAVKGKSVMSREDLGISRRIASEFSDKSRMAKAVDTVFKSVGLSQIDAIFKSTAINAAYNSAVKLARNPKTEAAFRKKLEPIFEKETDAVLDEFKNGEVTENTKLYVFNEVADIQPIALSEMALKYLSGGNGRIFYMLKTYTQKMLDVYRNEVFNKIKTPGQRTEGIKNLISLTAALVVMNTGADVIKDLLFGRPVVLEDHVVDNVWRTIGASRYTVEQAKRDGIGTAALKQILPPAKAIDAAYKDIKSMGDGKGSELVQSVPIFGKFYYWWFGKGADKSSKVAVKVAKDRYYRMAMEDKAKTGEISQKTADIVKKDMRLSDSDLNELWKRIQIGDDQAYKVSKMPFDKALKEFEKASAAEKKVLEKILAGKYDRLSDEKKAKFDPEIQRILAEAEEEPLVDINKLIFGKGGTQ